MDLPTGIVQVRCTVFNGRVEAPKTAKGNRSIKLTETSIRALREHERITITLDTYSHVLPNMQEKAVEAMENIPDGKD